MTVIAIAGAPPIRAAQTPEDIPMGIPHPVPATEAVGPIRRPTPIDLPIAIIIVPLDRAATEVLDRAVSVEAVAAEAEEAAEAAEVAEVVEVADKIESNIT